MSTITTPIHLAGYRLAHYSRHPRTRAVNTFTAALHHNGTPIDTLESDNPDTSPTFTIPNPDQLVLFQHAIDTFPGIRQEAYRSTLDLPQSLAALAVAAIDLLRKSDHFLIPDTTAEDLLALEQHTVRRVSKDTARTAGQAASLLLETSGPHTVTYATKSNGGPWLIVATS